MKNNKNDRSVERYEEAGARMRLLKVVANGAASSVEGLVSESEMHQFYNALDVIRRVCDKTEKNMYKDHTELTNEYNDVFYGGFSHQPLSEVDAQVANRAKTIVEDIFSSGQKVI